MPERLYRPFTEKLAQMDIQLQNATQLYFMKKRNTLERMQASLQMQSPKQTIYYGKRQLDVTTQQLTRAAFAILSNINASLVVSFVHCESIKSTSDYA